MDAPFSHTVTTTSPYWTSLGVKTDGGSARRSVKKDESKNSGEKSRSGEGAGAEEVMAVERRRGRSRSSGSTLHQIVCSAALDS
jgi:hypothetical protein